MKIEFLLFFFMKEKFALDKSYDSDSWKKSIFYKIK